MNTKVKRLSAFNYFGGKNRYLDFIIPNVPKHEIYVEPFCGSCAVLLNKPISSVEIINDMDSRIINFFRVLRTAPDALIHQLHLTPYSSNEYQYALEVSLDPIEDARRFFIRAMMNFGGSPSGDTKRKSSIRFSCESRKGINAQVSKLISKIEGLNDVATRISLCQIDNRNALEIMSKKHINKQEAFIFLDPPYLEESRNSKNDYHFEMTNYMHTKLAQIAFDSKAKIMVCGYPSLSMDSLYPKSKWKRISGPNRATNLGKRKDNNKIECIWVNYDVNQKDLFN